MQAFGRQALGGQTLVRQGTTVHQARRAAHVALQDVTDCLIAEFAGDVPAGTVIGHVALAREQLLSSGVRSGLAEAAGSAARARLRQLVPVQTAG